MKWDQVTFERLLVALILLLAVGVRLFNLGRAPLSDGEASWALQSLSIARGIPVEIGPQPGEVSLTGLAFMLFGSSNFMAPRCTPPLPASLWWRRRCSSSAGWAAWLP